MHDYDWTADYDPSDALADEYERELASCEMSWDADDYTEESAR